MDTGRADHWFKQEVDQEKPSVSMRIDVRAEALGLSRAPVGMHLSPLPSQGDQWAVEARTWPGKVRDAGRWFQKWRPVEAELDKSLSPDHVRLRFEKPPAPWDRIVGKVRIDHMCLSDIGILSVVVDDEEDRISRFLDHLQAAAGATERIRTRPLSKGRHRLTDLLTPQQLEAVFAAEALGYYDDNRRLSLRDLAKQSGRSVSAMSQMIRRAEARIVQSCVDRLTALCGQEEKGPEKAPATGACPCAGGS